MEILIEVWKDIKGYEGLYQINIYGEIKSLSRKYCPKERILLQSADSYGYFGVSLGINSTLKRYKTHKLMAITFLNNTPCGHKFVVDHIDNNKANNKLDNLQIISQRLNTSKNRRGGTSKYLGVHWCKHAKGWVAQIQIKDKHKRLGYFDKELDASEAYQKALKEINYFI